jgi:hypothetical protein
MRDSTGLDNRGGKLNFSVCDRGIEPHVVCVDLTGTELAGSWEPGVVIIGVDQAGVRPRIDPDGFDLLLTSASPVPRGGCWIHCVDPVGEASRIRDAVMRHGRPAVVLAQTLRVGAGLGARDALMIESFAYSTLLGGSEFRNWLAARRESRPPRPQGDNRVRIERHGDVVTLILSNPGRHNAFDARMRDALVEALAFASEDPSISGLELRADGPHFCSGGDLDEFGESGDLSASHAIRMLRSPARLLSSMSMSSVAYVHGACVGAGIEIPGAARRVVATSDAQFWLPELAMGLIPGAGGTWTLARRVGRQRLLHWALGGERIGAATALEWGLIDAIA